MTKQRKKEGKTIKAQVLDEDINEINFDVRISQAVTSEQYPEAIRLHYLKCLKHLSDQDLINWQIDKTNHEYEVELRDERIRKPFGRITYLYENICYGDFPISRTEYDKFAPEFDVFDNQSPTVLNRGTFPLNEASVRVTRPTVTWKPIAVEHDGSNPRTLGS